MDHRMERLGKIIKQIQSSLQGDGKEFALSEDTKISDLPENHPLQLLQAAKGILLELKLLVPSGDPNSGQTPTALAGARYVFELGALVTVALNFRHLDEFTRYFHYLQPFYALPPERLSPEGSIRKRLTGLYMMHLLTQHDYAGFHSLLEQLELQSVEAGLDGESIYDDPCIKYPIELEQALMEGSYNLVYQMTNQIPDDVPGEFRHFSEVLLSSIRSEIGSCSSYAYTSMSLSAAKNLFFFSNDREVGPFLKETLNWEIGKDGRVYTVRPSEEADERIDGMDLDDDSDDSFVGGEGATSSTPARRGGSGMGRDCPDEMVVNLLNYAASLESIV